MPEGDLEQLEYLVESVSRITEESYKKHDDSRDNLMDFRIYVCHALARIYDILSDLKEKTEK